MIKIRKSNDRGHVNHGWLNTYHTFSFADYLDPEHMGFSVLRVINEDRIAPNEGFDEHGHQNMEIISYVIEGALEHKDSMGNRALILPGEIQRMSAGSGVRHSEFNHLKDKQTHFLQIWILPEKMNIPPSYAQKSFVDALTCCDLLLVATKNGRDGSISLNQDVDIYVGKNSESGEKKLKTSPLRHYWLQVVKGEVEIEGEKLFSGDGAQISDLECLKLRWKENSEFLFFDLP